jgi:hypothetical protein
VEEETEEEDLEGEEETTGIGSSSTAINFSRILGSNNNPFNRIKVHIHNFLHSLMGLLLVVCLLPRLSKVPIPNSIHGNLDISPTNGLLQVMKRSHKVLKAMWKRM